ncbi:MAG: hypothetical protein V3V08_19470 [Nannocystaceae bacterium]
MFRALVYVGVGWVLAAAVPALGSVFRLTVMLPSTSAVVLNHVAFSGPRVGVASGLVVATAIGYLEDLHQGAPAGTLTLAHAIAFLVLHWVSIRIALPRFPARLAAAAITVVVLDLLTWAVLSVLADAYGFRHASLNASLETVGWHALATMLVAYPVWMVVDACQGVLRPRRGLSDLRGERGP